MLAAPNFICPSRTDLTASSAEELRSGGFLLFQGFSASGKVDRKIQIPKEAKV
jgi:hypothetical protein